jgi:hypothetical protein
MLNVRVVPESEPEIVPVNVIAPAAVAAVTDPDTDEPDCDVVHAMVPAPVESELEPE